MALTFSQEMDKALNGMDTDVKASVKTAFTDFNTAMATQHTAYGTPPSELAAFKDELIELAKNQTARMRPKA